MTVDKKEWLIRKAKRRYLGPFTTETIKNLIRESELGAYDEIARSGHEWCYLKDCPPFVSYIEASVSLASEETTAVIMPHEVQRPHLPTQRKQEEVSSRWRLRKSGLIGSVAFLVLIGLIWIFIPKSQKKYQESPSLMGEGVISEPKLKELSETFQQYNLLFYQGKLEESAAEYEKAIQSYQQALKYKPDDLKAKVRMAALILHHDGSVDRARHEFLKLLAARELEKSQFVEIQNYLGLCELKENNMIGAAPYFLKSLAQDDSFAPAHFNLGYSYFFQKQYYNARKYFERAVELQPNMPLLYLYLGRTLQKLNKDTLAIREYTNANRINSNLSLPYLYLSFIHFKLKQKEEALSFFKKMIRLDPEYDQNSFRDLRYMQEELSYGFIIQAYSLLLKEKSISSELAAGLGLLHYLNGNREKGEVLVQRAIRLNLEEDTAHTIEGFIFYKDGNFERALEALQTALRYDYKNSLAHLLIADIHIRLGRYEEALEHGRKILSFEPYSVKAYYILGVALIHLDRVSEGVDALNKALEYDPSYIPAKKILLQHSK